jgi:hypothetical protein
MGATETVFMLDSRYVSGRAPHWIKSKNPNAPAVKRGGGGGFERVERSGILQLAHTGM